METKRLDKTIKNIDEIIATINKKTKDKLKALDEDQSNLVILISKRSIDVLEKTKVMLNEATIKIDDDKELNDFLDRVDAKCLETKVYFLNRLNEIKPVMDGKYTKHKSTMEGFLDNENIKNAAGLLLTAKDSVEDFINKPETKAAINKAKLKILDEADKGLNALLKLFDDNKKGSL